jgi:spermidine synthase
VLGRYDSRTALLIDGVVQSLDPGDGTEDVNGYWPALIPEYRPEHTLLLGLGGGTVARLLLRRFARQGSMTITGVDDDPRVLELARNAFGLDWPGLTPVQADALDYLRECRDRGECFDLVVVDLFRYGAVPDIVCSRRFLGCVADVLERDGLLTINLNRGPRRLSQLRRLALRFAPERLIATGMNLVVHARPHPKRRYRRR